MLGLCHGVFTDRFILRHILELFFPQKWNLRSLYEGIQSVRYQKGKLGLAWRTNRSRNVEQEAVIAIFHLYTPLMSSNRKGRSNAASQSSNQSPEEKRSKNSETDEVFEALEMAEDVGLKLQRVLDKLEKLDKIEAHLSEVSASLASIEEKVSRLDEDVQDLKQKTDRVEKKASELEESIQFNEDDISDLKKKSKESKFAINDLCEQLLYLETYSRRENVKFFGIDEVVPASAVDSPPEDTRDLVKTLVVESSSKESMDWESLTTVVTNLAQLTHVSYDIRTRKW